LPSSSACQTGRSGKQSWCTCPKSNRSHRPFSFYMLGNPNFRGTPSGASLNTPKCPALTPREYWVKTNDIHNSKVLEKVS
jgi:hypothetical protein